MTDMQELAERLMLQQKLGIMGVPDDHKFVDYGQAAEAILTLERERDEAREANTALMNERAEIIKTKHEQIAQLTAERNEWEKACDGNTALGAEVAELVTARATAAEAQVQALREALERIEAIPSVSGGLQTGEPTRVLQELRLNEQCRMIARAALRSEP